MWQVFSNNARQLRASKGSLFVMLLLPVALFALAVGLMGGGNGAFRWNVALVDHDDSALSRRLQDMLEGEASRLVRMEEQQADDALLRSRADLAVIVPEGFEKGVMRGDAPMVTMRTLKGQEVTGVMSASLNLFVSDLLKLREIVNAPDAQALAAAHAQMMQGAMPYREQPLLGRQAHVGLRGASGFLIYVLSVSMLQLGGMILKEKRWGTLYRIRQAPVSRLAYVGAVFLTGVAVLAINLLCLYLLSAFVFRVQVTLSMYALWLMYGMMWILLGIFLALSVRSSAVYGSVTNIITVIGAMMGGSYWPIWLMPEFMRKAALAVPQFWANDAMDALQQGKTLIDLPGHLLALAGFGALFLSLCVFALRRSKAAETFV